jgi:hypothetical protein
LNGGNPDGMTLRRFIGVAYAIFVEEYQRLNIDLVSAVDQVRALGSGEKPPEKPVDNAAAIQELMGMMGGVKGAPV